MALGDTQITITTGTIVKTIVILLLFMFLFVVRDLVLVVLTAVVIASALEPANRFLVRRRLPRVFAVIVTYLVIAALFAVVFYFFVPVLLSDVVDFLQGVPFLISDFPVSGASAGAGRVVQSLSDGITGSSEAAREIFGTETLGGLVERTSLFISSLSESFLQTVSFVFGGALSFVLIIVLSFYLSVQEDGIEKFLRLVVPLRHEAYALNLWQRSQEKIGKWMQGQLLLGILVGILVYLGLTVLGVRNALLFAALAAIFEAIPLFGPILSSIPPIVTGFVDGGASLGFLTLGLFLIIQQFENHLIYPLVVKKIVGIPSILVILALIIGVKLGGFLGIILSVPMATTLVEYLNDVQRQKRSAVAA